MEVDALSLKVAGKSEKEELINELCKKVDDVEVELKTELEKVCLGDHMRLKIITFLNEFISSYFATDVDCKVGIGLAIDLCL